MCVYFLNFPQHRFEIGFRTISTHRFTFINGEHALNDGRFVDFYQRRTCSHDNKLLDSMIGRPLRDRETVGKTKVYVIVDDPRVH